MNSGLPVYVAAPYERAPEVRAFHTELSRIQCIPVSVWANTASAKEDFSNIDIVLSRIELNDECLYRAAVVVVLSYPNEGGEMFCEISQALHMHKCPILWIGTRAILSTFREGIYVCERQAALTALEFTAKGFSFSDSTMTARIRLHTYMRRQIIRKNQTNNLLDNTK